MSTKLRVLIATAVVMLLVLPATGVAAALNEWNVFVFNVQDGDTFALDEDGDNNDDTPTIRMTGIQAMELDQYRDSMLAGDCMAPEAARRLIDLIDSKTVRLSAMSADSTGTRGRLQRFVDIKKDDGTWLDVGQTMLREGMALWSSNGNEWVRNRKYYLAAKRARAQGTGIWDPTYRGGRCEPGPQQNIKLDMWIQWDADGADGTNVNGEWIRIRNRSGTALDIGGWTFRDPSLSTDGVKTEYQFPGTARIPAYRSIQLKVGDGQDVDDVRYFWGHEKTKFENVDYSRGIGDGGYLFDRDGSIRASFMYPCMPKTKCTDPLRGKVKIVKANYNPSGDELKGEYIDIKNVSSGKVRLEKYQLEMFPYGYAFARTDILKPGQVLRLWIKKGTNGRSGGRLVRYWGFTNSSQLNNSGDWVRIKTFEDVQVACLQWGGKTCGVYGK